MSSETLEFVKSVELAQHTYKTTKRRDVFPMVDDKPEAYVVASSILVPISKLQNFCGSLGEMTLRCTENCVQRRSLWETIKKKLGQQAKDLIDDNCLLEDIDFLNFGLL